MHKAYFRFYEELNDFLPLEKRKVEFGHGFTGNPSVKDMIASLGVPHQEIDLILVNGISVDLRYQVHEGDRISVYPVFESFDISEHIRLRTEPLREPRFILDVHLGKLARYMRMLGFDTAYENNLEDDEIVRISKEQKRTILTRDRGILKRNEVTHGYWIRHSDVSLQLKEVLERFHLDNMIRSFTRCIVCNTPLTSVDKSKVIKRLPEKTKEIYYEFYYCSRCERVYWKGSHYQSMRKYFLRNFGMEI